MGDLISRSALLDAMPKNDELLSVDVRRIICESPKVDAVEVVRCRDCKWWTGEMLNYFPGYCLNINKCMAENWYCASGEMREAESDA